jgi:hypothetical protein
MATSPFQFGVCEKLDDIFFLSALDYVNTLEELECLEY